MASLLATSLLAQSELEPPDSARYLRWGPVRARPGLNLTNFGYDDNILLTSDDRKIGDVTATVSPKLVGLVLFGHGPFLTFEQRFDYTAYATHTDQNFLDNHTSGRFTFPIRHRFGVFAEALFSLTHQRPVDLEELRPEVRGREAGFGFIFEPGWRTELQLTRTLASYSYQDQDLDSGVEVTRSERLNRDERGTVLTARYKIWGRTKIIVDGRYRTIDFDLPFVVDNDTINRDTTESRLLGGLRFGEGGPLRGQFSFGWDNIDAVDPLLQDLSTWVARANLAYRLNSRTRFILEGERLPGFALYGANSYYLLSEVELRAVYYFTRIVGIQAAVRGGILSFPDDPNLLDREDQLKHYEIGIRFRMMQNSMGRRVEYSFTVRQYQRDSTLENYDRTATKIGFNAVLGF